MNRRLSDTIVDKTVDKQSTNDSNSIANSLVIKIHPCKSRESRASGALGRFSQGVMRTLLVALLRLGWAALVICVCVCVGGFRLYARF